MGKTFGLFLLLSDGLENKNGQVCGFGFYCLRVIVYVFVFFLSRVCGSRKGGSVYRVQVYLLLYMDPLLLYTNTSGSGGL
ncbi:hypothetical protein L1887_34337 [Cichorium endivia]|nr:hypothetical protein L1887_34337 [Cichorium endivia]